MRVSLVGFSPFELGALEELDGALVLQRGRRALQVPRLRRLPVIAFMLRVYSRY